MIRQPYNIENHAKNLGITIPEGDSLRLMAGCVAYQCWRAFRTMLWQSACATATVERNMYKICSSSAALLTHRAGPLEPSDFEASAGVNTSKHDLDLLFDEGRKEFILPGCSAQIDRHERPCKLAWISIAEEGSLIGSALIPPYRAS